MDVLEEAQHWKHRSNNGPCCMSWQTMANNSKFVSHWCFLHRDKNLLSLYACIDPAIIEGRLQGKKIGWRLRMKSLDWMMKEHYSKLKERAGHRGVIGHMNKEGREPRRRKYIKDRDAWRYAPLHQCYWNCGPGSQVIGFWAADDNRNHSFRLDSNKILNVYTMGCVVV